MPFAFRDIEMIFNEDRHAVDWILRYGNEKLAEVERVPLSGLIGNTFGSIFSNMDDKWLCTYERATLYGERLEIMAYSPEIDSELKIICFPTFSGHCGCILHDMEKLRFIYPLIPFQEVMYYEATTYNNAIQPYYHSRIFDINTSVNLAIMQNAVDMMVRKYETLRMAIEELDNGRHVTVIKRDAPIKVEYDDICKMSLDEQEQYFEAFRISDTVNSFATNNFMRIFLLKRSDSAYRVLWSNSHLIIDGWSRMIILKDFLQTLQSLKMNQVVVESVAHSFYDYVKWLYTQDFEAAKQYWDAYMSGYTPKCLFGDIPPISDGVYTLREYAINIDDEKTNALNTIARVNNITVGVIVQYLKLCGCRHRKD